MIDFDRFWAEPGSFPGMAREQAEAQLRQMGAWLESMPGASGKFDMSMVPGMTAAPGVTGQQIAAWESEHGVALPEILRDALTRRNGGYVRETQFRILPLEEIDNPDEEFWEWASCDEEEVPDRTLVFRFAEDEFGGECLLVYTPDDTEREPGIFVYHSDGGDLDRLTVRHQILQPHARDQRESISGLVGVCEHRHNRSRDDRSVVDLRRPG
jgi:hypothetical protein